MKRLLAIVVLCFGCASAPPPIIVECKCVCESEFRPGLYPLGAEGAHTADCWPESMRAEDPEHFAYHDCGDTTAWGAQW